MRFASLGSGSEGNGLVVEAGSTRILIDCGFGVRDCAARLARLGIEPASINAIFVTHEHADHVGGVPAFAGRHGIAVWLTFGTMTAVAGRLDGLSRIYGFDRGDETLIYIGSADLMPRNLDTRVELLTPIRDESLRGELVDTLDRCFADNTNAWDLQEDGSWTRPQRDGEPRSVQRELMSGHGARAAEAAATS